MLELNCDCATCKLRVKKEFQDIVNYNYLSYELDKLNTMAKQLCK